MTLNISLTPHLEAFIQQTVNSGRYQSADDVIHVALGLLETNDLRLEKLQQAAAEGIASGRSAPVTDEFWNGLRSTLKNSG